MIKGAIFDLDGTLIDSMFIYENMAQEMLAEFERRGVKMCIVTVSERPIVEAALRRNDILKYFDKIITCGEVGHDKNRPDIYRAALEYLGTDKSETVVFEDELHAIQTARNDGFTVFAVADASVPEQDQVKALCDLYITDYHAQLNDIINW